jgi:hypothetical protein
LVGIQSLGLELSALKEWVRNHGSFFLNWWVTSNCHHGTVSRGVKTPGEISCLAKFSKLVVTMVTLVTWLFMRYLYHFSIILIYISSFLSGDKGGVNGDSNSSS